MKVASLIAHTAAGWSPLAQGEDIDAIKQKFKGIKVADELTIDGAPADCVVFMDSRGNTRRKVLKDPETKALTDGLNKTNPTAATAAAKVVAEADANARATAEKVVRVVADAIKPLATEAAPQSASVDTPETEPGDSEDEPAEHFASRRQKPAKK